MPSHWQAQFCALPLDQAVARISAHAINQNVSAAAVCGDECTRSPRPTLESYSSVEVPLPSITPTLLAALDATQVPIFGHINAKLLERAADLASFIHFEAGETIYKQGDHPHAFYVVLHGEVTMTTRSEQPHDDNDDAAVGAEQSVVRETQRIAESFMSTAAQSTLTVGQHFGEVGVLLPQTPCIATTVAAKRCSLLTLESSAFIELFGKDTNLLAEMQIKVCMPIAYPHARCLPTNTANLPTLRVHVLARSRSSYGQAAHSGLSYSTAGRDRSLRSTLLQSIPPSRSSSTTRRMTFSTAAQGPRRRRRC